METKHSKGEWYACCLNAKPHFVFAGEGEKTICAICHNDKKESGYEPMMEEVTVEECRANARLIQAAPKLLDALQLLLAIAEPHSAAENVIYENAISVIKEATK